MVIPWPALVLARLHIYTPQLKVSRMGYENPVKIGYCLSLKTGIQYR